jgi:predicted metal-dependent HD superfamily phosphohydrolase
VSGEGVDSARRLALRWPLDEAYGVRDHLLAAYAEPRRGYHDLRHLAEVLDHLDLLLAEVSASERAGVDDHTLRLAAWFHDAVYSGAPDDEERSARLAEESLAATGLGDDAVAEVARLVRLTATHDPAEGDLAGALLSDADLAVLAAGPERYSAYVSGVRREYSHVPDEAFRRGRAEVLRALLAAPALFRTQPGRRLWERDARANVEAELATLGS